MATKRPSPTRRPKAVQIASKSSRVKTRASKRRAAPKSKILAHVGSEDGRSALLVLARRHPELLPEIEDIIREGSATVTFADVAGQVVEAIAELTILDMGRNQSTEKADGEERLRGRIP